MGNKRFHSIYITMVSVIMLLLQVSCNKYLDKKPAQNLAVPSTLEDLQAVQDNQRSNGNSCPLPEFVADNYYLNTSSWNNLPEDLRNNYIWANNAVITNNGAVVWGDPYAAIYESNFVLELLPKIKISEADGSKYNSIKGTALFYRSIIFYDLAQVFCKPYSSTASTDLGIILRTTSEVTASISRSTVQETYDKIISDLKIAIELLPNTNLYKTRPNKTAAYGLLSRVYLSMRDYSNAENYANAALGLSDTLLNYNSLTPSGNPVLPADPLANPEIAYISTTRTSEVFNIGHVAIVDSVLYQSYSTNDLRRVVYFGLNSNGTAFWKGSYYTINDYSIFNGIVNDEIYLIRAECRPDQEMCPEP